MDTNNQDNTQNDSLEAKPTAATTATAPTDLSNGGQLEGVAPEQRPVPAAALKKDTLFKRITKRVNIYLLLFILLLIVAVLIAVILALSSRGNKTATIGSQTLSTDTLKQLANSDATVGDPKQVLNVQSNAIFAGSVLIRQATEIAGNLTVGGSLKLAALNVSGDGTFDQLQSNGLSVSGNAGVQGQLTVQKSLSVSGSGTFSGPVTAPVVNTGSLQLNGDFATTKHITTGGSTPSKSDGNALGGGGTSSVSGSDTAGTVTVNTGNNPPVGCFLTLTFTQRFAATPHINITPVGSDAARLNYYINRSATSFSICTADPAPTGASFGFDYFIVG